MEVTAIPPFWLRYADTIVEPADRAVFAEELARLEARYRIGGTRSVVVSTPPTSGKLRRVGTQMVRT